jgi:hypothetical protein
MLDALMVMLCIVDVFDADLRLLRAVSLFCAPGGRDRDGLFSKRHGLSCTVVISGSLWLWWRVKIMMTMMMTTMSSCLQIE